jgi:hypothetical protein
MFFRSLMGLSLLCVSSSAFPAKEFVIAGHQTSGYTRMEDAFENHCSLDVSGRLSVVTRHGRTEAGGWLQDRSTQVSLPDPEIQTVLELVRTARMGPFREEPVICDTGDLVIRAGAGKSSFPVIEIHDCSKGITNLSGAAKQLEAWVRLHCQWAP